MPDVIVVKKLVLWVVPLLFKLMVDAENIRLLANVTTLLNILVPLQLLLEPKILAPEMALSTYSLFVNSVFDEGETEHIGALVLKVVWALNIFVFVNVFAVVNPLLKPVIFPLASIVIFDKP